MSIIDKILESIPSETKRLAQKQGDISVRVNELINGQMTQRELAKKLGVSESRLSKILSGQANLTLKTITKLESVLGEEIITVPSYNEKEKIKAGDFFETIYIYGSHDLKFRKYPEAPNEFHDQVAVLFEVEYKGWELFKAIEYPQKQLPHKEVA